MQVNVFITGLEYKFMVKSVDPDGTATLTDDKKEPGDVVMSLSRDFTEDGTEEKEYRDTMDEPTSPAPVILLEKGILPNQTGKKLNHRTCPHKLLFSKVHAIGQTHRWLRYKNDYSCSVSH